MEKLILRGVMWGADKIPDSVFEKIPGGFYKEKQEAEKAKHKSNDMKKRRHHRRRYSDDEFEDDDRRGRRDREDGYRSDGHDRRSDARQSYDGGDDETAYDSINDRPRRQRSRVDLYRNNGDKRRSQTHRNGERVDGGFSYGNDIVPPPMQFDEPAPPRGPPSTVPTVNSPHPSVPYSPIPNGSIHSPKPAPSAAHRSTSTLRGGIATGYVPYADIYGGPTYQAPSTSEAGSVQPNYMNQLAPVVAKQPYQQNPFAQEAPLGAQPAYVPDPYQNARRFEEPHDDRQAQRYDDRRSDRFDDRRYDGDDSETERGHSRSPPRRRHSTRDGRTRSRHHDRAKSQGRGKSGVREAFDTSEKGLGYGAVGAIAGGLVGSELGKGLVPTAIGTAIGAFGANAFQARERYVDSRVPLSAQMQSMPQPPRRKEEKRHSAYDRRRGDDYYSD